MRVSGQTHPAKRRCPFFVSQYKAEPHCTHCPRAAQGMWRVMCAGGNTVRYPRGPVASVTRRARASGSGAAATRLPAMRERTLRAAEAARLPAGTREGSSSVDSVVSGVHKRCHCRVSQDSADSLDCLCLDTSWTESGSFGSVPVVSCKIPPSVMKILLSLTKACYRLRLEPMCS